MAPNTGTTSADRPPAPTRLLKRVTTVPFLVTAGVLAVLLVAYTLAGFFLLPRLVAKYVPRYVQEHLERRAELGEVRVNPWLFTVEIKHFRLQEAESIDGTKALFDGTSLIGARR